MINSKFNNRVLGGSIQRAIEMGYTIKAGTIGGYSIEVDTAVGVTYAGSGTGAIKGGNASIFNSWTCDIAGQSGNETKFATIIGSESSQITGGTRGTVLVGCSGRTGLNSHTTYVETLEAFTHVVLNDYSNLNFANDSAAATGGVPLGGLYHNAGDLKVRIT